MKRFFWLSLCCVLLFGSFSLRGQSLYDDSKVSSLYLEIHPDSFQLILNQLINDRYLKAKMVFDDGLKRDTLEDVGLRLRGNTSLGAQKKSFKISLNAFVPGREYQGVRKINLRGQHNDPTMVREKLFYEVWKQAGLPERRASFVRLYINQQYRGLYTNIEEFDKQWLDRHYADNDGNLYKCTWPADLVYHGPDQATYKAFMNNPEERAYELQTNETADDYADLVNLITVLNQPVDAAFPAKIQEVLHVSMVLKAFAIDVACGHWDDYFYNKNNYYLYRNPESGRFDFIAYDTDNTFGVDWLGKDWAKRNCLAWLPSDPRPLATKLLEVPAFKQEYLRYLDTLSRFIIHPDSIFPRIDALEALITPAATDDVFRTLDYGYTLDDFHQGFDATVDNHTPYGIKPFLDTRYTYTRNQITGVLAAQEPSEPSGLQPYPNPAVDYVKLPAELFPEAIPWTIRLIHPSGAVLHQQQGSGIQGAQDILLTTCPTGVCFLQLQSARKTQVWAIMKMPE